MDSNVSTDMLLCFHFFWHLYSGKRQTKTNISIDVHLIKYCHVSYQPRPWLCIVSGAQVRVGEPCSLNVALSLAIVQTGLAGASLVSSQNLMCLVLDPCYVEEANLES